MKRVVPALRGIAMLALLGWALYLAYSVIVPLLAGAAKKAATKAGADAGKAAGEAAATSAAETAADAVTSAWETAKADAAEAWAYVTGSDE